MNCKKCIHKEVCYLLEVCNDLEDYKCDDFLDQDIISPIKIGTELFISRRKDGTRLNNVIQHRVEDVKDALFFIGYINNGAYFTRKEADMDFNKC